MLLERVREGPATGAAEVDGKGKRGLKAEDGEAEEDEPWLVICTGEVEGGETSFSRLGCLEGAREGTREDDCDAAID